MQRKKPFDSERTVLKPQSLLLDKCAMSQFHHRWRFSFYQWKPSRTLWHRWWKPASVRCFHMREHSKSTIGLPSDGGVSAERCKREGHFQLTNGNEQRVNDLSKEEFSFSNGCENITLWGLSLLLNCPCKHKCVLNLIKVWKTILSAADSWDVDGMMKCAFVTGGLGEQTN